MECTEAEEILEVVTEEAELLTGPAAVLAMHQLALCPREQHAALRGSQPFAQLLALLERHSPSLGPKVPTSTLPGLADDESALGVSALAAVQEHVPLIADFQDNFCWFKLLRQPQPFWCRHLSCAMLCPAGGCTSALESGKAQTEQAQAGGQAGGPMQRHHARAQPPGYLDHRVGLRDDALQSGRCLLARAERCCPDLMGKHAAAGDTAWPYTSALSDPSADVPAHSHALSA